MSAFARNLEAQAERPAVATSAHRSPLRAANALSALRDEKTYRAPAAYRQALSDLSEALRTVGRALDVRMTPSDFLHPALSPLSSGDLARVARDPEMLPGWEALDVAAREILDAAPGVVGVSASYLSQALHAYALAGLLRKRGFGGLLLLGGGVVGSWAARLQPDSPAFDAWDALVRGPGEEPLRLAALAGTVPDVEGVLAPRFGLWNVAKSSRETPVSFRPDASTLAWGDYLAPGGILPVAASRGCYWARCAFCPEAAGSRQPYRAADAEQLAADLIKIRDRHGIRRVHFTDNAVSPAHMRRFAALFRGQGISWYGFARIEKTLAEPGFLESLAEGGCTMLQLGIESATPRLLDGMKKGIDIGLADRIVRRAAEAGIRVYGYFLFGLPTETQDEARRTLDWIAERADCLTFLNLSLMNLPRDGEMEEMPERFGVEVLKTLDGRNDLSLYWGFSGGETVDRRQLRRLLAEARKDPALRAVLARTPKGFTSNHAAFSPL
jgi:hypothetical protein